MNQNKQTNRKVAIIFIGTNQYLKFFKRYYKTIKKLFLPKTPKDFFVFTNKINYPFLIKKQDVFPVYVESQKWPFPTLYKFKYINKIKKKLEKYSHIIYLDADMWVYGPVKEEEFFLDEKPLFGVQHPSFVGKVGVLELNPKSLASVDKKDDLTTYWEACFWGGKQKEVLKLCQEIEKNIDQDLSNNIIAIWHDESHLNKYFIKNKKKVHTYDPGYAYSEAIDLPFQKKIIHLTEHANKYKASRSIKSKIMKHFYKLFRIVKKAKKNE